MKLVRFEDGTYGVRKGWFIYLYADLKVPGLWWGRLDTYFSDCKGSKERALEVLGLHKDKGTVVK